MKKLIQSTFAFADLCENSAFFAVNTNCSQNKKIKR